MNFLRFKDLKQRGVVRNWTTLARLVDEQGFPAGTRLGAQTRAWEEAEVTAWLESRRITPLARDASLLVTRRDPVQELVQEPAPVAGVGSARGRHKEAPARSTPPPQPRSLALPEDTPRR